MNDDLPKSAMILAAGFGTRMQPLTKNTPKPLLEVCGKTMLDRTLDNIAQHGIINVVVNAHYLWKKIKNHIIHRNDNILNIIVSVEEEILDSGGAIVNNINLFDNQPFFVINGDVIWLDGIPSAFYNLHEHWDDSKMDALLLLQPLERGIGYDGNGDFNLDGSFDEVIYNQNEEKKQYVFTGIWLVHPRFFDNPPAEKFSVKELFKRNYNPATQKIERVFGIINNGTWLHVGTPEGLKLAERYINVMTI